MSFTQQEATDLANVLKFGALPLNFEIVERQTVSPTLGEDQLKAGLLAGAIGLVLVVVYLLRLLPGAGAGCGPQPRGRRARWSTAR